MAGTPGTFRFPEVDAKPAAPPSGYALLYIKTDNVLYLQDSSGTEIALGSASSITQLTGDVSADGPGSVPATVNFVGGYSAAEIATAVAAYVAAASANTPTTLVKRDASGNFSAGVIYADLVGSATSFTGSLSGDVSGTQGATVVDSVGGSAASAVHTAELAANAATATNTPGKIVKRDGSGNFSAGTITADLNGNAATADVATDFSGDLDGDVSGPQGATVVDTVGGSTASAIHTAELLANAATSVDDPNKIVKRDGSGNFAAGIVTADLHGNADTATNFTGSLAGDVSGTQSATSVDHVGGSSAANIHAAELAANAATSANTPGDIVKRDGSGNFSAGIVTADLHGAATSFTGSLAGDVSGTQGATVVDSVGGSSAANVHAAELAANAATAANSGNAIVKRDASGNFAAGTITGTLSGNATNVSGIVDVTHGGTNANTAAGARTNLGVAIGTDVQAHDSDLDAVAALSGTGLVTRTGAGTAATRTVTGTANRVSVTNGDGVAGNPTLDVGSDVYVAGGTDVAVADGGTGASTASGARTNLGLAIGTDVQAHDADLDAVAGLSATGLVARTGNGTASARTITGTSGRVVVTNGDGVSGDPTLDLGSGVYVAGGTDVAVADGGTGASTASAARSNLGLAIGTDVQAFNASTLVSTFGLTVDGRGGLPLAGSKGFITIPYGCTINNWYLAADVAGSCVVDIKRSGTSIIGAGNKPTLSSAISGNAAVSGWTSVTVSAGDILEFNLDSATTLTRFSLVMKVTKT